MSDIKFTRQEKQLIVPKIQEYVEQELDLEIGNFDAEFLLDFFAEEIGPYFYNRGVYDARATLDQKMEGVGEALLLLEKPTELGR
ncbi:MAG: DUF2164 domain-containing protein [Thermoanaerobaculia bacterium]|nr:DUF2164 domain-containing protein [Thermoanaerobaculia bacterium]